VNHGDPLNQICFSANIRPFAVWPQLVALLVPFRSFSKLVFVQRW